MEILDTMPWKVLLVSAILVLDGNADQFFGKSVHKELLLNHLKDEERVFLFGNGDDHEFEIAHLHQTRRHKRSPYTHVKNDLDELIRHLELKQAPRSSFLDPHFLFVKRWSNVTEPFAKLHGEDIDDCFYRSQNAALFVCEDVRGMITSDDDSHYFIHPLPERFHKDNKKAHVIVKKTQKPVKDTREDICLESDKINKNDGPEPVKTWTKHRRKRDVNENATSNLDDLKEFLANNNNTIRKIVTTVIKTTNTRQRRATIPPAVFVETAVFVDRDLYKHMTVNFPKDTERDLVRFVLAMVNAVQLLYHDPSLGRPVNFILKRLEILHEDPANLKRPHDIDRFLSNFCTWQRLENPPGDNDPLHWDHALILTGLDLYVVSKNGKVSSQVVGLAPVAGMCTVTSSCTVNEGRHFESVYVVAHEIGHNLGMRHDGPLADNGCDPSAYIMSPTLGSGKITWSLCSRNYLHKFLDTIQSRCLLDHGNSAGQLDHSAEGILPGERFDADQQCMLKYGSGSRHATQQRAEAVCRDLHCARARYTWTSHPALDGTACGHDMYCRGGECEPRAGRSGSEARAGAGGAGAARWGGWARWSDCASACLLQGAGSEPAGVGVAYTERKCTSSRHDDGKKHCKGPYKKYQTCHAHQCENVSRLTVREFADQICRRAREVDPDLIGTGLQRMDSEEREWSCAVWCRVSARGGGLKSRGWTLPDGTRCARDNHHYCIAGLCQKFTCSSDPDNEFSLKDSECAPTNDAEDEVMPVVSKHSRRSSGAMEPTGMVAGSGVGATETAGACHYQCVWGARGLRLARRPPRPRSIQLCTVREHNGCSEMVSPLEYASSVCGRYRQRVARLSGLGLQLAPVAEEPDRACRVACQDGGAAQRFYLVSGRAGWMPLGTPCSSHTSSHSPHSSHSTRNASYCVSGKCLEFGADDMPVTSSTLHLPLLARPTGARRSSRHRRRRRSLQRAPTRVVATLTDTHIDNLIRHYNLTESNQDPVAYVLSIPDNIELDLNNPIHIAPEEALFTKTDDIRHHYSDRWTD